MSGLSTFSETAKNLARNPLGIIALFIVLIYGLAALTLGLNSKLDASDRTPLVWFLVIFPVAVLGLFGWLVSQHHEKLYAPGDYRTDDIFYEKIKRNEKHTAEIIANQEQLKARVTETIQELSGPGLNNNTTADEIVERITKDIDNSTSITIDARNFIDDPKAIYSYPIAAFETVSSMTNDIYYKLRGAVEPFHYGHTWVLRNKSTNEVLKSLRILAKIPPGKPLHDPRSLSEVGVIPGSVWMVENE